MELSLCSSSFEKTICPWFKTLNYTGRNLLAQKPFAKVGYSTKKDTTLLSYCVAKMVNSSHLMPERLEGSYIGRKRLKEASKKLEFVRTLLIDNYDSYTYNIYQELSVINGLPPVVVRNDEWTWEELCYYLFEENAFDNIVISPGPGSPTCPSDIGICLRLLLECSDIPILGVCLGHQALGYVHGADIIHASEPVHGRLSEIEHTGGMLFHDIPSGRNSGFNVVRYHSLVIDASSLPKELIPIAWTSSTDRIYFLETRNKCDTSPDVYESQIRRQNASESYSNDSLNGVSWPSNHFGGRESRKIIMGIMHTTRPHYGLQFHPESIATSHGKQIFKNFRDITVDHWLRLGSSSFNERKGHNEISPYRDLSRSIQLSKGAHYWSHVGKRNMIDISHLGGCKYLKLKWRKYDGLAKQAGGARKIFCGLFGDDKAENTFWLDSSSVEKGRARFSFMGGEGGSLWKQLTFRLSDQSDKTGGYLCEDFQGFTRTIFLENGFLDFLNKELQSYQYDEEDYEGLPFDFFGGYVGYIGYGLKAECGVSSNCHKSKAPDACLFFADNLVVIDHHSDDVYILSLHDGTTNMTKWLDNTEKKLLSLKHSSTEEFKGQISKSELVSTSKEGFVAETSRDQYIRDIEKCMEFIRDGESYELCLTTRMRKRIGEIDSLGLYLELRENNPAPYSAWLNFSKDRLSICCSSPERFLRLDRNGILEAKPIKGTIARSSTYEEDEHLRLRLQYSEKDQAENLMIVDLLRNDLGRVCEPGSVHVPHLMEVESYATVHTMVSTIRGKRRSEISPVNCVKAAFPGGSMTGAPKLRSMEILDSLEKSSRGIYSGSIGFFSYNKTFDLNIVIRTVVIHEGEASIGAGGAIVALSNPGDEYEEMLLKTRAPVKAVMEFEMVRND